MSDAVIPENALISKNNNPANEKLIIKNIPNKNFSFILIFVVIIVYVVVLLI